MGTHGLTTAHYKARDLQVLMREVLIDHANEKQPFLRTNPRHPSTVGLIRRGLLRTTTPATHTELTMDGKEVVCIILGHYADAIIKTRAFLEKINFDKSLHAAQRPELELAKMMSATRY